MEHVCDDCGGIGCFGDCMSDDGYCGPCGGPCLGGDVHDQAHAEVVTAVELGIL